MLTRRCFTLLAVTLPLNLLGRRTAVAQNPQFPTQEEIERKTKEWQQAHHLPVALVHSEGERALYSSAVNSITCWADAGTSAWLGTQLGIKRVSQKAGTSPRHYTRADGLPGEQISAIVADERGAYALVDLAESEALCGFDIKTDAWKTLAQWAKGRQQEYGNHEHGYLTLGKDVVLASAGVVFTKTESPLVCFGRENGEQRSLPWDSSIRADHTQIVIRYLSCREKTVALGTSIGLLEVPLSADGGTWTRKLAEHSIVHGVEGHGKVYLWLEPRQGGRPGYAQYYPFPEIQGKPHLYDPVSSQAQPLPERPRLPFPNAVVAEDGALWLIDNTLRDSSLAPSLNGVATMFARWKPGDAAWTNLTSSGTTVPADAASQPLTVVQPFAYLEIPLIPGKEVIPDGPARFAAANAIVRGDTYGYENMMPWYGGRPPAVRWLKERFAYWLSPEDPEAVLGIPLFSAYGYPIALSDPKVPERAWTGVGPGVIAAIENREVKMPPLAPEPRLTRAFGTSFVSPETPLERVPLPEKKLMLHARLRTLVPLNDESYLGLGDHVYHISEEGRRWQVLNPPPRQTPGTPNPIGSTDHFFAVGKKGALGTSWLERNMLQLDPATGQLRQTQIPRPNGGSFIGADASGAWWYMGGNRLLFLAPDATAWQERTVTLPQGFSLSDQPRLSAGRLWWRGSRAVQEYIGWDPKTDSWLAPLATPSSSEMRPVADSHGAVLVAGQSEKQGKEIKIYRWLPKKNIWEALMSIPWPQEEFPTLLAADSDGFWFLSYDKKSLVRYESRTRAFFRELLPNNSGGYETTVQVENDAFLLASATGLWRFDRRKRTWSEWKVPVTTTQLSPQLAVNDGTAVWGFLNARNAGPVPIFRFEPDSRRFSFFDESAGLPAWENGALTRVGGQIWLLHPGGAFRFNTSSQRFVREAPLQAQQIAAAQNDSTTWVGGMPIKANDPTLYRWSQVTKKSVPEERSRQDRCLAILSSGNGVLAATTSGLFRIDTEGVWTGIDTWSLAPTRLIRDAKGAIWIATNQLGYIRIDKGAGI